MKIGNIGWVAVPTLATALVLSSCGKKNSDSFESQLAPAVSEMVESSVNSFAGAGDDASGATVAAAVRNPQTTMERILEEAFTTKSAWAAELICSRQLTASAGKCLRDVNCSYGPYAWNGTIELTFSNGTSCLNPSIANPGDFFTRAANFTRSGPRGSIETVSSAHEDYEGASVSGGAKVTRQTDGTLAIDVLGVSKILRGPAGRSLMDVSFKTAESIRLNQLHRAGRVVTGGSLEIRHNLARYTAVHSYRDLTWGDANCCYPTSGTIDIAFSGNVDGAAQVVFNGCGSFSITRGEDSASFSLQNCE